MSNTPVHTLRRIAEAIAKPYGPGAVDSAAVNQSLRGLADRGILVGRKGIGRTSARRYSVAEAAFAATAFELMQLGLPVKPNAEALAAGFFTPLLAEYLRRITDGEEVGLSIRHVQFVRPGEPMGRGLRIALYRTGAEPDFGAYEPETRGRPFLADDVVAAETRMPLTPTLRPFLLTLEDDE